MHYSSIIYHINLYIANNSNSASDGFWSSSNNLGSYIIGILVFASCGLITFSIKEFYKKPPSFSGTFYLKLKTLKSAYNPYINLESFYMITTINDSNTKSVGRIEKIYDIEPSGYKRNYVGKNRNTGNIHLSIERFYVRKNKLSMHIIFQGDKNGAQRDSSVIVTFDSAKKITTGTFNSTAADSKGKAWLSDSEFEND